MGEENYTVKIIKPDWISFHQDVPQVTVLRHLNFQFYINDLRQLHQKLQINTKCST